MSNNQQGFSLLEVLIAGSISIIMMLGMLGLANQLLSHVRHQCLSSLAQARLQEMLERLTVNEAEKNQDQEFNIWNHENQYQLPEGKGEYFCNPLSKQCKVTISWKDRQINTLTIMALIE